MSRKWFLPSLQEFKLLGFFFSLPKVLDASDVSLRTSYAQWFDCLPGNWWEASLLKGKKHSDCKWAAHLQVWSRALPYLWIFLCQDGNHAPQLSKVPKEIWSYCLLANMVAKILFWCIFCWPVLFISEHCSFWVPHRTNLKLHKTTVGFKLGKLSYCFPPFTFGISSQQSTKITYMQEYLEFFLYLTSLLPLGHICLIVTSSLLQPWNIESVHCWCWSVLNLNSWF